MFSVAKPEALEVLLNPNMIYLHFDDISNMVMNGANVNSPVIPVMTTTVGGNGDSLADANAASGTFEYKVKKVIQVGNTVAIYTGVRPDKRTVATDGVNDGDVAYVHITAVNGDTYSYARAETDEVLFKPDMLPVDVAADKDGDPDNHSITIERAAMNYSDSKYEPLGLSELTTVDVGDFIVFYEEGAEGEDVTTSRYARITSITPGAETDVITYTDATEEDVRNIFNISQKQALDGDDLLSEEQIEQLEAQVARQARESGFVDQAADYLADVAMETQAFKSQTFLAGKSRVRVENLTVVPKISTTVKKIDGRTSGVSATLQIGADIVVNVNEEADLIIHMTGTFVQEISLNLSIDGETSWKRVTIDMGFFDISFSVPTDYKITANLDAYSYTGMNIKAEIALVEVDKLEAALDDWLNAKTKGLLGDVQDIAKEIEAVLAGVEDTDVDAESLKEQYQEMMEKETEWVSLIKQPLFKSSVRVAMGTVEVQFSAEFVLSAQVNLTIGADFYYKMAKRYSVSFRVRTFEGTTDTVNLPGDGDYQFTFYVMGTLGLRAGIHMEVKAGIGSVEWNSIGVAVEPGVYINLWGYFYYQLKNISGVKTTKSLGALYVEIGIYLEAELGYQIGDGAISDGLELFSKEWPLYWIGEPVNVYDFVYPQDEKLGFTLAAAAKSLAIPESLLTMKTLDLKEGEGDTKAYPASNFDIQVDNKDFKYNPSTQKVEVVNTSRSVSTGNLVITWKGAPLSFSSEPIQRTIPLTWLAREGDYTFQMEPQNGGVAQVITAAYNAPISVNALTHPGYTFDGWYTAAAGGTKVTIPSRMPAEDRVLYAHWTANTNTSYTVEHYLIDPNTGQAVSTTPDYTQMLTGTTDTEIVIDSERYKSQGYANGKSSGTWIKGDGSTVVKIGYQPTNRSLTFELNYAGAPESTVLTEQFGKNIANRIPVPTRTGYTFAGWSPEAPSVMPKTNTTYTATWTANTDTLYKIMYLKQNVSSNTYTVADTESYRGTTAAEANLTNVEPKTYEGFMRDDTAPGTTLTSLIAGDGKTVLKVYYKRNTYPITIDYADSITQGKTINVPFGATTQPYLGTPTREGYAFAGWSPSPPTTVPAAAGAYTAQWTLNNYTVSFEANGGSGVFEPQTLGYGGQVVEPTEPPTKEGYVFGGWYSNSQLTTLYTFTNPVNRSFTLYAKWLQKYTVSFESNGGSAVSAQTVNEGARVTAPTAPTQEGQVFGGWFRDSELTTGYDFTQEVVTSDLTLYAKWTEYVATTYTVSFESNGGSVVASQSVTEGAVATIPTAPTQSRYTFEGWYSDSQLTQRYGFTQGVTADLTLYAKWTENRYTVNFETNGGSDVSSQTVVDGEMATEPTAPTRDSFIFEGWYSDGAMTTAYSFDAPVTGDLTLYAKWGVSPWQEIGSMVATTEDSKILFDSQGTPYALSNSTVFKYEEGEWKSLASFEEWKWAVGFAIDGLDTLYVAYPSGEYVYVKKYNGTDWEFVGDGAHFGDVSENRAVSIAFDSENMPYIAFMLKGNDYTQLAKYDGEEWTFLGNAFISEYRYGLPFISFDSNSNLHEFQMYGDSETSPDLGVLSSKYENGTRQIIGNKIYPVDWTVQAAFGLDPSDTPHMLYVTKDSKLVLTKYTGSAWENVGDNKALPAPGFNLSIQIDLAFNNQGVPYVAYQDAANENKITVMKYQNGWVPVGTVGFSEEEARDIRLSIDNYNNVYVKYKDAQPSNYPHLMRFTANQ